MQVAAYSLSATAMDVIVLEREVDAIEWLVS